MKVDDEVHAYLKVHPNASIRDISLECNMTERQARKYYQSPKNARQKQIIAMLKRRPHTTIEIAEKLGISYHQAWYAISNLQGTGKIEKATVWRLNE